MEPNEIQAWYMTLEQSSSHGELTSPDHAVRCMEQNRLQARGVAGSVVVEEVCKRGVFDQGRTLFPPILILVLEYVVALFRKAKGEAASFLASSGTRKLKTFFSYNNGVASSWMALQVDKLAE